MIKIYFGVNALGGLFSFLHGTLVTLIILVMMRVNALGGLFSFLLHEHQGLSAPYGHVSMPSAGSSHFYSRWHNCCLERLRMVSMPSAGSSHFYSTPWKPA